jgi:hypothetical protein
MPRRPEALEQGALDGLCGIYSIVNSILWALRTYPPPRHRQRASKRLPSDAELGDLFIALLSKLVQGQSHLKPVVEGASSTQLLRLLSKSSDWLTTHRALELVTRQPFYGKKSVPTAHVVEALGRHLARPGAAAIIGIEAPFDHWTVVRQVTRKRLLLLDSEGVSHLSLKEWGDSCGTTSGLVHPDNIFMLRVTRVSRGRRTR